MATFLMYIHSVAIAKGGEMTCKTQKEIDIKIRDRGGKMQEKGGRREEEGEREREIGRNEIKEEGWNNKVRRERESRPRTAA